MKQNLPKILGHRGASAQAPENTKAAFEMAHKMGADGIETDLQLAVDGTIVVHHNYRVDGTSNGTGAICRMTLEELKRLDMGAWKGEEFAGQTILTLEELLNCVENFPCINLELKAPVDRTKPFVKPVVEAIRHHGLVEEVILSSFDLDLLRQVKLLDSRMRVGWLTSGNGEQKGWDGLIEKLSQAIESPDDSELSLVARAMFPGMDAQHLQAHFRDRKPFPQAIDALDFPIDCFHPHYQTLLEDPTLVEEMHQRHIQVNPYTVDDPKDLAALRDMGCDGIITNRVDTGLSVCHFFKEA